MKCLFTIRCLFGGQERWWGDRFSVLSGGEGGSPSRIEVFNSCCTCQIDDDVRTCCRQHHCTICIDVFNFFPEAGVGYTLGLSAPESRYLAGSFRPLFFPPIHTVFTQFTYVCFPVTLRAFVCRVCILLCVAGCTVHHVSRRKIPLA